MVNACAEAEFFVRGGGGVQAQRREKKFLDFFNVCFGVFLSKIFRGCRGSNYLRGGGGLNASFYRIR